MGKVSFVFGLLSLISASVSAQTEPLTCSLTYHVKGGGLQIGLGYFKLQGNGELNCDGLHGAIYNRLVHVTIGGHPVAARIGVGVLELYGASGSFGFNGSIDDLYGHYAIANVQAAVILGAGAEFSVENPSKGLRFNVGIAGSDGFGAEVGFSILTIEPEY